MRAYRLPVCLVALAVASGCSTFNSKNSPDIVYSENATQSTSLQVPPDLTQISNAQQFVVPGNAGEPVTRNTLLPQFANVRFVRQGAQSWLAFQQTPEDLWPQLLAFLRNEKYNINKTEPVAGIIVTQWRPDSAVSQRGLLSNLVSGDEDFSRVAFRLERAGTGARLFARSQVSPEDAIEASENADDTAWPANSHSPENTSELLSQFLVFLGLEQQRAQGVLGNEQTSAIFNNATLQSGTSGSELVVHRGFQVSFRQVINALEALNYEVVSQDDSAGLISATASQGPVFISLTPLHAGAVRVSLVDEQGVKLPAGREQPLLASLVDQLT